MSSLVPKGWSVRALGKLADVRSSNVDKKTDESEQPVRLCNYTDVYYRKRITSEIDFMHATAKPREIERFSLKKGDVIITKDSEAPDDIAVPSFVSEELEGVVCGYHLTLLRPYSSSIYGEYLSYLFQLPNVQHYFYLLANGTTRFGLTADAINNAPLTVAPLPEQQKIATILSSVDNVIEKTRAQIDKLKDLKAGMMQELLTKGIGHTEFKDSSVGRIPKDWSVARLSEVFTLNYGRSPKDIITDSGSNSVWGTGGVTAKTNHFLHDGESIILGRKGTIDQPRYVSGSFWVIDTAYFTTEHGSNSVRFLHYLLQRMNLASFNEASGVPSLSRDTLYSVAVALPTSEEQREIADIVHSIELKKLAASKKYQSLLKTKKALMQDLLTGKVRVKLTDKQSADC